MTTEERLKEKLAYMRSINHPERYYQTAFSGNGWDVKELTHNQISTLRAAMDCREAEIAIYIAENIIAEPEELAAIINKVAEDSRKLQEEKEKSGLREIDAELKQ